MTDTDGASRSAATVVAASGSAGSNATNETDKAVIGEATKVKATATDAASDTTHNTPDAPVGESVRASDAVSDHTGEPVSGSSATAADIRRARLSHATAPYSSHQQPSDSAGLPYNSVYENERGPDLFSLASFNRSPGILMKLLYVVLVIVQILSAIINMAIAMLIMLVIYLPFSIIMGLRYWYRRRRHPEIIAREEEELARRRRAGRFARLKKKPKLMTQEQVDEMFPIQTYKEALLHAPSIASSVHSHDNDKNKNTDSEGSTTEHDSSHASASVSKQNQQQKRQQKQQQRISTESGREAFEMSSIVESQPQGNKSSEPAIMQRLGEMSTFAATRLGIPTIKTKDETTVYEEDEDEDEDEFTNTIEAPTDNSCAICIEEMQESEQVRLLKCGHIFHAECIDPWLTTRRAYCPLCKHDYYIPPPADETNAAEELVIQPPPAVVQSSNSNSRSTFQAMFGRAQAQPSSQATHPLHA